MKRLKILRLEPAPVFNGIQRCESIGLLAFQRENPPFEHEKKRATYKYNLQ
jgi:hypothetical protein